MGQNVMEITDANFESEVLKSDKPVLIDFWAVWCGPCRAVAPAVEELAGTYASQFKVGKLNVDDHEQVPAQFNITSIPTLLFFKGGKLVDTIVGAVPKAKIEAKMKALV